MKCTLRILLFVLIASGLVAQRNNANKSDTHITSNVQSTRVSEHNQETQIQTKTTDISVPHWYASSEWWLVIIAALTGLAIAYQAQEMTRATRVAKASADAALLNAQAVINAERPWIFIEHYDSHKSDAPRYAHTHITGRNKGRTPAVVTVAVCRHEFLSYDHEFSDEPKYPKLELMYQKYLAPEECFDVFDFDGRNAMTDELWDFYKSKRLTFIGRIIYKDLITWQEHETRFCYFLSSTPYVGLIMNGPRNYNEHT